MADSTDYEVVLVAQAVEGYLEVMRERGWPAQLGEREHVAVQSA